MIYIIIPVFNRLHFTIECLDSLRRQTITGYTIIIADDGSTDGTFEHLRRYYPEVVIVQGDGTLWWAGATNAGVKKAMTLSRDPAYDFILTLNNDLVVKEGYLGNLIELAKSNPSSLIGSLSVDINQPEKIHYAGTRWNSKTARYRPSHTGSTVYKDLKKETSSIPTDLLPGRGVLIPVRVFKEIGFYDEETFPHYMADEDFSLRARKAGYTLLVATKAVVYNHIDETGLKEKKRNFNYYKSVFTSMKSATNTRYRWNWARKHATIFPPVYFTIDLLRILKSLIAKG
ncbi:MAG: glycosyltransferase family 2 protein [Chitinophagaceae bacterium]|nr:glycosyltransferase family 2 protein [Chitinophagaceae bacterium]